MITRNIRILTICLAAGLIFLFSDCIDKAQGYAYWYCTNNGKKIVWEGKAIKWRAGKNSFPYGSTRRDALNTARGRWNQAPGKFTFSSVTWGDSNVGRSNGQTEIWFSTNQSILDGAPAVCYTRYRCIGSTAKMLEADIIFDNSVLWGYSTYQFSKTPYGGSYRPFGTTALHEMGHSLGLAHVNYTYNIMGSDTTHIHANNGKVRWYPGEDSGNGEVFLYGKTGNTYKNDLGVTHWKYGSASGEYSSHITTKIYTSNGENVISSDAFQGFRRYYVKAGSTYKVQFTYENNGYYNKNNINVGYYISTNDYITTLDRRIQTRTLNLARNKVYTKKYSLTIPADLVANQTYYVGVIVDYTGSIAEFSEVNNATYIPIRIVP